MSIKGVMKLCKNIFLVILIINPLPIRSRKRKILCLFDFKIKIKKKDTTIKPLILPKKDSKVATNNKMLFLIDINK